MVAVPVDQPTDQVALSGEREVCDDDDDGDKVAVHVGKAP